MKYYDIKIESIVVSVVVLLVVLLSKRKANARLHSYI